MAAEPTIKRRLAPARRRAEIIEAARDCIAELGLERATVRVIAEQCSISVGTVSYHFPTLDGLLVEVLRDASKRFTAGIVDEARSDKPAAERLEAFLDYALPSRPSALAMWRLWLDYWGRAVRDVDLAELQAERYAEIRALVGGIIEDGIVRGEFAPADVERVAAAIVAVLDGVGLQLAVGDTAMTDGLARFTVRACIRQMLQAPDVAARRESAAPPH